jgi:3',5'-cyclic AMP phosphodiesterase CpdA
MIVAQISDLHITTEGRLACGRVDTAAHLARAVAHLARLRPRVDVVLATGDLVDAGRPDEYARLRAMLAPLAAPVYVVPGNHDERDALRAAFADHRYLPARGWLQYAVDDHPLRLVGLDTLVPGEGRGELCDERLDWLEARLAESRRPTLLFLHHPPFACGIDALDELRLRGGAERLAAIVARHPNVERVLCGHAHRPMQARWAGTVASVAPSTAHQASLDLEPGAPLAITLEPPAIALHRWHPGAGLVTHLSYVGDFDGPRALVLLGGHPGRMPAEQN